MDARRRHPRGISKFLILRKVIYFASSAKLSSNIFPISKTTKNECFFLSGFLQAASEYYPQEELVVGGRDSDQSDRIKEFLSRCKFGIKFFAGDYNLRT